MHAVSFQTVISVSVKYFFFMDIPLRLSTMFNIVIVFHSICFVSGGRESSKFSFEHIWNCDITPISYPGEAANRSMYFVYFFSSLSKSLVLYVNFLTF